MPASYISPLGYKVELTPQFTAAVNLPDTDAEFAMTSGSSVVAVFHAAPVDTMPMDADMFTRVTVARYDVPWSAVKELKEIKEGEATGYTGAFDRSISGQIVRYRFKSLCTPERALMAVAWSSDESRAFLAKVIVYSAHLEPAPAGEIVSTSQPIKVRRAWAGVLNSLGVHCSAAGQWSRSLPFFQRSVSLMPEEAIYAENVVVALSESGMAGDALAAGQKAIARFPNSAVIKARVGLLLAGEGKLKEAIELYKSAMDMGLQSTNEVCTYLQLLVAAGEHQQAIRAGEDWMRKTPNPVVAIRLAQAYVAAKDHKSAVALLQQWLERSGTDPEVAHALMSALCEAGKYSDAFPVADRLQQVGRANAVTWYWRGTAHLGLHAYREARAAFEKSLELNPKDQVVIDALKLTSGLLGEGDRRELSSNIPPVEIPRRLFAADHSGFLQRIDGYGGGYLNCVRSIRYVPGERTVTTDYYEIIVVNQDGVKDFNEFLIDFDPLAEEICINKVQVFDASNKLVAEGSPTAPYVLDKTGYMATYTRVLHVPIPGLQPGLRALAVVTRRAHTNASKFDWHEQIMAGAFPIARMAVVLNGDVDKVTRSSVACRETRESDGSIVWEAEWPPIWKWEPLQDDPTSYLPHLGLGDRSATWPGIAREYMGQIHDFLNPSREAEELLAKIAPDPGASDRLSAILRYMQTQYAYKAIEFGRRARIPEPVSKIIANRYGDCKDHALLTMQLLRAAGIPAQLALVRTSRQLAEELPSLDPFDHVVVYARINDQDLFFDTTSKSDDLTDGVPPGLEGRLTLVLDERDPHLVRVSERKRPSAVNINREVTIDSNGNAVVVETARFNGRLAAQYRDYLRMSDPANRRSSLRTLLQGAAIGLDLHDAKIDGIEQPDGDMVIELKYSLRRHLTAGRNLLVGTVPVIWERMLLTQDYVDERMSPFRLRSPLQIKGQTTIRLADGLRLEASPESVALDGRFSAAKCSIKAEPHGFTADYEVLMSSGRFKAEEYEAFRESLEKALDLCAGPFVVDVAQKERASAGN